MRFWGGRCWLRLEVGGRLAGGLSGPRQRRRLGPFQDRSRARAAPSIKAAVVVLKANLVQSAIVRGMSRRKVSKALWLALEPLIPEFVASPKGGRRRSIDDRAALGGILYVLHTGIPWEDLPQELGFGSGMTCSGDACVTGKQLACGTSCIRPCWSDCANTTRLTGVGLASTGQACPAPRGGEQTGPNPTDRGKLGSKRHLVVDARGVPLAITVTGANRHDSIAFESTLDAIPAIRGLDGRPRKRPDKLHADKAYDCHRCRQ
ncbi:IS5 family transposase [Ralstonia solanacearum]